MLLNVYGGMKITRIQSIDSLVQAFWVAATPRLYFAQQGEERERIDLRLVEKIEGCLVPRLGHWEQTERWWHQMDCEGDGVRQLMFDRSAFELSFLDLLHQLLVGEHAKFGILCSVYGDLGAKIPEPAEFVAGVMSRNLLVAGDIDRWFSRAV